MINAHIEQSSVYWAQHEKKLYKFRILELSEPFCEGRNGNAVLSRSCDNVTQRLRQLDHKRCKRPSEPAIAQALPSGTCLSTLRQNRTQSLPMDLQTLFSHDFLTEKSKRDQCTKHPLVDSHGERKLLRNGYNRGLVPNPPGQYNSNHPPGQCNSNHPPGQCSIEDQDTTKESNNLRFSCEQQSTRSIKDKEIFDEVADAHCTEMKSSLRDLSSRFDEEKLQTKSKEELISIILELQDALRLSTDD